MSRSICIIGVPMDLGQSRRGVDMGPSGLRYAGLDDRLREIGCTVRDCGNVEIPVRDELPPEGGMTFLPAVVEASEAVYRIGRKALAAGDTPLYLGGDHSIALGTVAAATEAGTTGLLWIDAHGDFNTPESSPSGNLHGMPLAALTGLGSREMIDVGRPGPKLRSRDVVLIGVRSLDPQERVLLSSSDAALFSMRDLDERGAGDVVDRALARLDHCDRIHVSLDLDCVDPREAPGVGTPVRGGITVREAHMILEKIADDGRLASIDVVEINPILDDRNRTSELGVELVASLLGNARVSS